MRITKTTINAILDDDTNVKAIVAVEIDAAFTISGIRILEYEGKHHIVMPGYWDCKGYFIDFFRPADKEVYEYFRKIILTAYKNHKILDDIYDLPEGYKGG